jgi:hypothetical protein
MKKTFCIAVVIGMGLALVPRAVSAQVPADQPAASPAPAAVIPLDQQATKEQLAKLFELMRVREQLASVTKLMPTLLQQQMQAQFQQSQKDHPEMASMTEEQQQAFGKVMNKYMERVMTLYTSDEMIADMSALYQKHLTRSDVDGMIAFYSSPAGQHMLDIVPVIMQEFMPMVMNRVQERIKPALDEMTKEMEGVIKPSSTLIKVGPPSPPVQK